VPVAQEIVPTDFADIEGTWSDKPTILETSTQTVAYRTDVPTETWSEFLIVTVDPLNCESIKFMGTSSLWTTPTGHVDAVGEWSDEAYAYNDYLHITDFAYTYSETDYLELTIAALTCSGVRIYCTDHSGITYFNPDISLDVYYSADWHNIFSGGVAKGKWVEKVIGSTQSVTAARVKFTELGFTHRIYEFDFGSATGQIDVDVYYQDAWHDIYQGAFTSDEWVEKSLGGIYMVEMARIRLYNASTSDAVTTSLKGFRFMKLLGRTEKESRVKRRMLLVPKRKVLANNVGSVIGLVEPTYR